MDLDDQMQALKAFSRSMGKLSRSSREAVLAMIDANRESILAAPEPAPEPTMPPRPVAPVK